MPVSTDNIVRVTLRERARLLAYVMVIFPDEHAAEDILQDITLSAISKQDQIEGESHLMGWLRRAARFRALELRRNKSARATSLEPQVIDLLESHWQQRESEEISDQLEALRKCIKQLTPHARKLIELRYVNRLSGQRLADRMGQKLGSAYAAVSRIHKVLHECMRQRLDDLQKGAHHAP